MTRTVQRPGGDALYFYALLLGKGLVSCQAAAGGRGDPSPAGLESGLVLPPGGHAVQHKGMQRIQRGKLRHSAGM